MQEQIILTANYHFLPGDPSPGEAPSEKNHWYTTIKNFLEKSFFFFLLVVTLPCSKFLKMRCAAKFYRAEIVCFGIRFPTSNWWFIDFEIFMFFHNSTMNYHLWEIHQRKLLKMLKFAVFSRSQAMKIGLSKRRWPNGNFACSQNIRSTYQHIYWIICFLFFPKLVFYRMNLKILIFVHDFNFLFFGKESPWRYHMHPKPWLNTNFQKNNSQ